MFDHFDPDRDEANHLLAQALVLDEAATLVTTHPTTVAASAALLALAEHRRSRAHELSARSAEKTRQRFEDLFSPGAAVPALPAVLQLAARPAGPHTSTAWRATGRARQPASWWRRAPRRAWRRCTVVFEAILDGLF
jgi:hypothetical protein